MPSIIWHPHESGAVREGVAPVDALCPGPGELSEWVIGLKMRPRASTALSPKGSQWWGHSWIQRSTPT